MIGIKFSLNLYSCLTTITEEQVNVLGTNASQLHCEVSLCPQDDIHP